MTAKSPTKSPLWGRLAMIGAAGLVAAAISMPALSEDTPVVRIDDDGTVHMPTIAVPVSSFLSPEGKAYLADHLKASQDPVRKKPVPEQGDMPGFLMPYLARMKEVYAVQREITSIAGVPAYVYTPQGGAAAGNEDKVLINLHGGGFAVCFPGCAEMESIPVASVGGYKVVSLDYRQGSQHRFPAASEDVAAVYRDLLKTYRPENIGIYGCSAGGLLTAMSLAWFQTHDLPRPGAAGVFCAGLSVRDVVDGGDGNYTAYPLGEARLAAPVPAPDKLKFPENHYLSDVDPDDPLVSPRASMDVLSKFPPTLFITGTRGMEVSSAAHGHAQLTKAGVEADLHIWDGMFHGFFYNPDVPESREAYDVMVKFFRKHLGKGGGLSDAALAAEAERARAAYEKNNAMPDTPGTGPFPAIKEIDPRLPQHVVYRPAQLKDAPPSSLGLVLWGNGSCAADGSGARLHLAEIASHGFVVIAPGTIRSGPGGTGMVDTGLPPDLVETTTGDLRVALEWALAENVRPGSPYYGLIDPKQIAVMGYSCGGLQAVELAADPRIKTVIINNSGVFTDGPTRIRNLPVQRSALEAIHTPILYILGGPSDVAYENGMADFRSLTKVPAVALNIDTGHAGTFYDPNGGAAAQAAVSWLKWQLRGDKAASKAFVGDDCTLCADPRWKIERKLNP